MDIMIRIKDPNGRLVKQKLFSIGKYYTIEITVA